MGPCLMMCCKKFGSVLAAIGHAVAIILLIVMFEVLWFLERWSISKALLGMIAVVAIQRFLFKTLTCIFLTREFRHDESNRAWWYVFFEGLSNM
jgi:1,3-beta-glucan synthase